MRPKTTRKPGRKERCCVVDAGGKKVACFTSEKDAKALARVVKKSRVVVACDVRGRR